MKQLRVHYLQHVPFEGPGYIAAWLCEQGHSFSGTHFYDSSYTLPAPEDIDALIILGGPMSVYDDHAYPWLHREKIFIEDCILAGKKVLGICLGAQLIALCLGAAIYSARYKEIGWFPVTPAEDCKAMPWLYRLFMDSPVVFHWHGDKFDMPYDDSLLLLSSEANPNQVFCKQGRVIGIQFHLELTAESLQLMLEQGSSELTAGPYVQSRSQIEEGIGYAGYCREVLGILLDRWLAGTMEQ